MAKKSSKNSNKKYSKKVKTAVVVNAVKNKTPGVKNNQKPKSNNIRKAVVVNQPRKSKPKKYTQKNSSNKTTLKKKVAKAKVVKKPNLEEIVQIPLPEESKVKETNIKENESFESKVDSIIEFELSNEKDTSLDDIDVLKFPSKDDKATIKKKNKPIKNVTQDISKIDEIEKVNENKIVEEFEEDLTSKDEPVPFKRKKKGRNYIINIHKNKKYKELEDNLRQLYDKVDDVVHDFDTTVTDIASESNTIFDTIEKEDIKLKPSLLDKISQKVLNVFLIILFIIFFVMCIAFLAFVIYVSTV